MCSSRFWVAPNVDRVDDTSPIAVSRAVNAEEAPAAVVTSIADRSTLKTPLVPDVSSRRSLEIVRVSPELAPTWNVRLVVP